MMLVTSTVLGSVQYQLYLRGRILNHSLTERQSRLKCSPLISYGTYRLLPFHLKVEKGFLGNDLTLFCMCCRSFAYNTGACSWPVTNHIWHLSCFEKSLSREK